MKELSDEQLIARVKTGDTTAYKELYHRYASPVLGLSYRIVGDRAKAEEIMQETFWRVWDNVDSFRKQRGTFPNWVFGIARNLSIDVVRRRKIVRMEPLPDAHGDYAETSEQMKDDHDVAEAAWLLMKSEKVHHAMRELPDEQREVVEWIYFQGMTRREIAKEKDIPFGTINTRAQLALKKLKRALESNGFFEES